MDIRTVSRAAGAVSLVLGPLALAVPLTVTDGRAPVAGQLHDYAADPGRALAANLLLFPLMLLVPAMGYAARLARPGAPRLAFAGGALAGLGWLAGLMGLGGSQILLLQASKAPDRAAAASMVEAVTSDPVYGALVGVFVIGHIAGMMLVGVALWRARTVPRWPAGLFTAYPILHLAGSAVHPILDRVSTLLLLAAGVGLGVRLLRTPDEAWDLPAAPSPARHPVAAAR